MPGPIPLELPGADIMYNEHWLAPEEAAALFCVLTDAIAWERHSIRLFGRVHAAPRLSVWIGDAGADYMYSRTRYQPRPWPPALDQLRERVSSAAGVRFNGVLANLYRDGRDAMGWHSDAERELGPAPVIASVSLGAPRRFVFRHREIPAQKSELILASGSLLLMRGDTQANYQHALPRTARPVGPRLNLTFRQILLKTAAQGNGSAG